MNWVDLVALGVIAVSGLLAFMRGFVREALGLGAWVVAAIVASPYVAFPHVEPFVRQHVSDPTAASLIAFGGVFVVVLILCWIIASFIAGAVRRSVLGGLDRTLGLLFGVVRGAVLLSAAYVLVGMAIPVEQWPPVVSDARGLPTVYKGAVWLAEQMPAAYRPAVAPPPGSRPTTAASLLQSSPSGRALGSRPARE